MTKKEMLRRVDSKELSEWMAYYSIEPFGEIRQDYRIAQLCCIMYNAWSKRKAKIEDFLFKPRQEQSMDSMKAVLKAITIARGGKIGRHGN